jgi:CDP-diacylglycerol--glycerol-3-phosphate 3-phosphatidyltransferase
MRGAVLFPGTSAMTLPNKITFARILLVPLFALVAWQYSLSNLNGFPDERLRITATGIFIVAAASDGLDGFAARRFNQRTRLGTILDPIADKLLVATALLSIVFGHWPAALPGWFAYIVIGRDLILAAGFFVLSKVAGNVQVQPNLLGKVATVLQMTAILWVLIGIKPISSAYITYPAAFLTLASGISYVVEGLKQAGSGFLRRR